MSAYIHDIKQIQGNSFSGLNSWNWQAQIELAGFTAPDLLMGIRKDMVKGDVTREWYKWIVEQFIEQRYLETPVTFPYIYADVLKTVESLIGIQMSHDDKIEISKVISDLVLKRLKIIQTERNRRRITKSLKGELLQIYGTQPRCWLTGYKFTEEAIFNFTCSAEEKITLEKPFYIDRYMPIGQNTRDLEIEVDHLHPFSLGGDEDLDNYRLICGWANKVKSNHVSGYSVGTRTDGKSLYPNSYYYWALRLVGLKRKCESPGCKKSVNDTQLKICSTLGGNKIVTPLSMKVVCDEHDEMKERFIKNA